MAPQLGQTLREARTGRGIELTEVERVTKVRIKFLRAMEEDRWADLPGPYYARSFLSTYARFLDLDDEALVDEYRSTFEQADRAPPIPAQVVHRGVVAKHHRSIKSVLVAIAGVAALVALGLVVVGSLGSSSDGGKETHHREKGTAGSARTRTTTGTTPVAAAGALPAGQGSAVSLELRSTAAVWVCLVDDQGHALVNGETLTAGEARGPFNGSAFEMTFGNGSVEMTVDGERAKVPPVAEPLGYRISPSGTSKLAPSARPTCL